MNDLISVIMSVYNEEEKWLRESIESILNQTHHNIEFIIVLDNPDNNVLIKIINEYLKQDDRIKFIKNKKNIGLAKSLNKAIKASKGDYIARMDADDISVANRLELESEYMINNNLDMVSTNKIKIDENNDILSKCKKLPKDNEINKILPLFNFITHPSVLMKTEVIKSLNGYRNFSSSQDYDLWLRMLSNKYELGVLDEYLILYRIRAKSLSNKDSFKKVLINKYQKSLYKKRIQEGEDDFSEKKMRVFFDKYNYYNINTKKEFQEAYKLLQQGISLLKNHKFITGSYILIKSFLTHKETFYVFINIIRYKIFMFRSDIIN